MLTVDGRARQLVILSGKGGTGKTSLNATFAHLSSLAKPAHPPVFVDADVDAANLSLVMQPLPMTTNEFWGGWLAEINGTECTGCGKRFTTYEKMERMPLLVVKKDARREPFDSQKIRSGIVRACQKRPVSVETIDAMVSRVEQAVYKVNEGEITTRQIGEYVMAELKRVDEVAYVRFASVYRQYENLEEFKNELEQLAKVGIR